MSIKVQGLGRAGSAAATITVTGSTNATPIVITLGDGHGLKDGDRLAIAGVTGNTAANGVWSLEFTAENTAKLLGSVGNGTHGGTVRVGVVFDKTPMMQNHSAHLQVSGNCVGTLLLEAFASFADFRDGFNSTASGGAVPPILTDSDVTQVAGNASTACSSSVDLAATNAGIGYEVQLPYILRASLSAYTSGAAQVRVSA